MKPARSSAYLRFIRTCACVACGSRKGVEAAHGPNAGLSRKGSDFEALPLCAACHREGRKAQHRIGWERFAEFWEIDLEMWRRELRERFERTR